MNKNKTLLQLSLGLIPILICSYIAHPISFVPSDEVVFVTVIKSLFTKLEIPDPYFFYLKPVFLFCSAIFYQITNLIFGMTPLESLYLQGSLSLLLIIYALYSTHDFKSSLCWLFTLAFFFFNTSNFVTSVQVGYTFFQTAMLLIFAFVFFNAMEKPKTGFNDILAAFLCACAFFVHLNSAVFLCTTILSWAIITFFEKSKNLEVISKRLVMFGIFTIGFLALIEAIGHHTTGLSFINSYQKASSSNTRGLWLPYLSIPWVVNKLSVIVYYILNEPILVLTLLLQVIFRKKMPLVFWNKQWSVLLLSTLLSIFLFSYLPHQKLLRTFFVIHPILLFISIHIWWALLRSSNLKNKISGALLVFAYLVSTYSAISCISQTHFALPHWWSKNVKEEKFEVRASLNDPLWKQANKCFRSFYPWPSAETIRLRVLSGRMAEAAIFTVVPKLEPNDLNVDHSVYYVGSPESGLSLAGKEVMKFSVVPCRQFQAILFMDETSVYDYMYSLLHKEAPPGCPVPSPTIQIWKAK